MTNIKQLLQFIQNHWALCTAFGVTLALIAFEELKIKIGGGGAPRISAHHTTLLLNRENAVALDLRNQKIFADGHILESINIVFADFDANLNKIESHKNRPIILVDDNESNTSSIAAKLRKHGFSHIYILAGGLRSWKDAQLPLIKQKN